MKILVIQLSRFGDAIQTMPMLRALRRRYPEATVTVLARHNILEIYEKNEDVDHLELFEIETFAQRLIKQPDSVKAHYEELKQAVEKLRLNNYDLVINVTHDRFSTFLSYLVNAPETKGMTLSRSRRPQILTNGFWLKYLKCSSVVRDTAPCNLTDIYKSVVGGDREIKNLTFGIEPVVDVTALLSDGSIEEDREYVAFQLGASSHDRCWPIERFAMLGDLLQEQADLRVVLVGVEEEKWLGEKLTSFIKTPPVDLIGKTKISDLAAVLKECAVLITNDTGTMHLAAAVGTPCVALFMESANPFQTGPYGEGHLVCTPKLDCFPCSTSYRCSDKKCLETIPTETIYQLVRWRLYGGPVNARSLTKGVRTYATAFDGKGIFELVPFVPVELTKLDLIRQVYRNTWLRYALETGDFIKNDEEKDTWQEASHRERRSWQEHFKVVPNDVFQWCKEADRDISFLATCAEKGLHILEEIRCGLESSDPSSSEAILSAAAKVADVDRHITNLGESSPWVRQLTEMFRIDLDQVEDGTFITSHRTWLKGYQTLGMRLSVFQGEVDLLRAALTQVGRFEATDFEPALKIDACAH